MEVIENIAETPDLLQSMGLQLRVHNQPGVWRAKLYDSAGNCATWNHIIGMLGSPAGREAFNYAISTVPFEAFTWETPVLCRRSASKVFEMSAFEMDKRKYQPIHRTIFEHIRSLEGAVKFPSKDPESGTISSKTLLISPSDCGGETSSKNIQSCRHIGLFTKKASKEQQDSFWEVVDQELFQRSQDNIPTWVCTEGTGVHWLHLRLQRGGPQYINTEAYKRIPREGQDNIVMCRYWIQQRSCPFGDQCYFSHNS